MITEEQLGKLEYLIDRASPAPWHSMREGNQFLETRYLPTAKCVGTSRVDGLPRPWNPHAVISFMKLDAAEVSRFKDQDADFIAAAREFLPLLVTEVRRLQKAQT